MNESDSFRKPDKLPTLLLYRKDDPKYSEPVEIDRLDLFKSFHFDQSLKTGYVDKKEFEKIIRDFLRKNK